MRTNCKEIGREVSAAVLLPLLPDAPSAGAVVVEHELAALGEAAGDAAAADADGEVMPDDDDEPDVGDVDAPGEEGGPSACMEALLRMEGEFKRSSTAAAFFQNFASFFD